ncbi:MAG: nicotinamide-nucleotide amidohydrolase family protein, partial [Actinomycetota bacterium]
RMAANNLRQALVPRGATVIPQKRGTAPGLICPVGNKVIYAVPGVPHEMHEMMLRAILPDLVRRSGRTSVIRSRVLRTWGESESGLNERLDAVIAELDEPGDDKPTLAFLASGWEGIKVRLTAGAATAADADAILDAWEARVRAIVDDIVFGVDDDTMESVVLALLASRGETIAVAESVTGGLVTGRLTAVPGASRVLRGGVVSYASEVKFDVLGVTPGPVVTERAAIEMARGVRARLGASVGLSLTGVAGPEEQDGVAVGTLFVGLVTADGAEHVTTYRLPATRDQMRQMSVISALNFLRLQLPAD